MAFQKLDKKQVPQVVVLGVLSCGVLGYFAKQIITPSPAAALSTPAASQPSSSAEATEGTATSSSSVSAPASTSTTDAQTEDPAPSPDVSMRDPFQQTVSASSTAASSPTLKSAALVRPLSAPRMSAISVPAALPLPAPGAYGSLRPFSPAASPLPPILSTLPPAAGRAAAVAPTWTVTGVLSSGADHVAILRSGNERRFVRQGEWLDGQFQVAHVGRDSVTLSQGARFYSLPLGGGQHINSAEESARPGAGPAVPSAVPASAPTPTVMPEMAVPSAMLPRPSLRKPESHAVLASVPHLWTTALHPTQQSALVKTLTAPRLVLSTTALPSLIVPTLHPSVKPVVKVAAFRAKIMVRRAVPRGMLAAGTAAPDFTLPTLEGHALSLSQLRGRPVVLTFWASWVPACGSAVPALQKAASDGHAAFVGVGTWDSRPALLSFARTHHLDTHSLLCDDSVANLSVAVSLYKVPDVPVCYVLDSDGRVAGVFTGFAPGTAEAVRATLLTLEAS